jgi:hypothetical protein
MALTDKEWNCDYKFKGTCNGRNYDVDSCDLPGRLSKDFGDTAIYRVVTLYGAIEGYSSDYTTYITVNRSCNVLNVEER